MRASPAPVVLAWLRRQVGTELFTTAVTVAEVRYGIARMPAGRRKDDLRRAADEVFGAFPEQVLPFDSTAAGTVSYTHLRAHETPEHLVCRLLLEKQKNHN